MEALLSQTIRAIAHKDPHFRKAVVHDGSRLQAGGTERTEYTGKCKPTRRPKGPKGKKKKCGKQFTKYDRPTGKKGTFEPCCMRLAIQGVKKIEKISALQTKRIELLQKKQSYTLIQQDAENDPSVYNTVHVVRKPPLRKGGRPRLKKYKFTKKTLRLKIQSVNAKLVAVGKMLRKLTNIGMTEEHIQEALQTIKEEQKEHSKRLSAGGMGGNATEYITRFVQNVWTGLKVSMSFLWEHKWDILAMLVVVCGIVVCCGSYMGVHGKKVTVFHSLDGFEALRGLGGQLASWVSGVDVYKVTMGIVGSAAAIGFINTGTKETEAESQHNQEALAQGYARQQQLQAQALNQHLLEQHAQMEAACAANGMTYNLTTGRCVPLRGGSFVTDAVSAPLSGLWRGVSGGAGWLASAFFDTTESSTGWRSSESIKIDELTQNTLVNSVDKAIGAENTLQDVSRDFKSNTNIGTFAEKLKQYQSIQQTDFTAPHKDFEQAAAEWEGLDTSKAKHAVKNARRAVKEARKQRDKTGGYGWFWNSASYNKRQKIVKAKQAALVKAQSNQKLYELGKKRVESQHREQVGAVLKSKANTQRMERELKASDEEVNNWRTGALKERFVSGWYCGIIALFGIWWFVYPQVYPQAPVKEEEEEDTEKEDMQAMQQQFMPPPQQQQFMPPQQQQFMPPQQQQFMPPQQQQFMPPQQQQFMPQAPFGGSDLVDISA